MCQVLMTLGHGALRVTLCVVLSVSEPFLGLGFCICNMETTVSPSMIFELVIGHGQMSHAWRPRTRGARRWPSCGSRACRADCRALAPQRLPQRCQPRVLLPVRQAGESLPCLSHGVKHLRGPLASSCDCRAGDEGLWAVGANEQTETLVQLRLMCPPASWKLAFPICNLGRPIVTPLRMKRECCAAVAIVI